MASLLPFCFFPCFTSAFLSRSSDGKWVIVAINYSEDVKPVNFQLDNHEQKSWQMYRTSDISAESLAPVGSCDGTTQLAPRSITTFMQK